jgi:hypothetical protein
VVQELWRIHGIVVSVSSTAPHDLKCWIILRACMDWKVSLNVGSAVTGLPLRPVLTLTSHPSILLQKTWSLSMYIARSVTIYTGWHVLYLPMSDGSPVGLHVSMRCIHKCTGSWKAPNHSTMETLAGAKTDCSGGGGGRGGNWHW